MLGRLMRPLILAAVVGMLVVPSAGAGSAGRGMGVFGFLGPFGAAQCDGSGVTAGTASDIGTGLVIAKKNRITAVFALWNLPPTAPLQLRLVQGSDDCHVVDATVTTDAFGRAFAFLSEETTSDSAFLAVDQVEPPPGPPIINRAYVTDTLWH